MVLYIYILFLQICFSLADILARKYLAHKRNFWHSLSGTWMISYTGFTLLGVFVLLYVYHSMYLGRAMILKSCLSLFLSALVGSLYLKEKITLKQICALCLIIGAIFLQGTR